jgi:RNA polymerase sigma factor (sigma-70 family)
MLPQENKLEALLQECEPLIQSMFAQCQQTAPDYEVTFDQFKSALQRSVEKYLIKGCESLPTIEEVREFLNGTYSQDLFLALACANGNEKAWWDFDKEYRKYIERITRSLTDSESIAEEAISAIYYELYGARIIDDERLSKFSTYSGRGSLRAWLKVIIWHSLVDLHRSSSLAISIDEMVENVGEGHAHASLIKQNPESERLDELTKKKYLKVVLQSMEKAFSRLSDHEKLILFYYYTEKLTLGQIAKIVEVPDSPLRSWFKRKTEKRKKDPSSKIHESTIMRWLEKTYKKILQLFHEELEAFNLKQQEVETCIEIAAEIFSNYSTTEQFFSYEKK